MGIEMVTAATASTSRRDVDIRSAGVVELPADPPTEFSIMFSSKTRKEK
jgi:hypothetical protein